MLLKSCPKCRGDLALERDVRTGTEDLVCLQCGYTARPDERAQLLVRYLNRRGTPRTTMSAPAGVARRRAS
jgi:hypothetical protein